MSFDPAEHREASLENWEAAASGWSRQQELMRAFAAPVSHWMIDALELQPGQRVLELAAGLAETGLLAAELVAPAGNVLISDQAEAMLSAARRRAQELGITNVDFKVLNAEWIDLPVASVDAVLCRWGYMLMADPTAALAETRRVLSSGGRVALAVWDAIEHNPWAALPGRELVERGIAPAPAPRDPASAGGPFAAARPGRSRSVARSGLRPCSRTPASPRSASKRSTSPQAGELRRDVGGDARHLALVPRRGAGRAAEQIDQIKAGVRERFAPYTAADGSLEVPGRTLVASASA